ncbi:putative ABC transporter substrate-binding protein YdcS [Metapseudomonas furukawaii]|uniref:putative ABC transporter substrate-binding protein YdcS n=1 Tax=Metapseudomonas furukawaii TaxID=1149133 RepID=UPI000B4A35EE|nr:putative ABC transporter substrate-binding protein YdcS [Pseudomonas sp. A46]OWJ91554.1 spermidine/putrescine ABC transporter substrate-binding protein [Pseudomonas sp. A46]
MPSFTPAFLSFAVSCACLIASAQAAEPLKQLGEGEGQVDIIAWPGYIERGETDKNYDWVTAFEKDTGCKVNVKTAATSDEMVSLMAKGGYDLVTASGDASLRLIFGKRVQPVNIALIPNWKTLDERLQDAPWHTVNGQHYGTPYQWGPNLLMYNTKLFAKAPDSWAAVFEEQQLADGKSNKGRVQAYDGPIYIADAALYLKSTKPELGIQDPYQLNEEQYAAVLDLLRKQHSLVHRYWHDATVQMSDFKNEGVAAASTWGYMANTLKAEGQPVATVVPKEGVTGWADTTMLHVDAKHPNCAYKWMNWSLEPKVQGDLAAWFGSLPVVAQGCSASELLGPAGCATNGYDQFDKIAFWKTPEAQGGKFVPYSRWTQDYIAIMGGR